MLLRCTICGAGNCVPAARLGEPLRCARCRQLVPAPNHPVSIGDHELDEVARDSPWRVLVELWSPASAESRAVAPELERLAKRHQGSLLVVKLNADQAPLLMDRLVVQALPTFLVYAQGRELKRVSRALGRAELEALVGES